MHSIKFVLIIAALALSLSGSLVANSPLTINLPETGQINVLSDDTVPEVTARVARISYIIGDVQIRRFESQEWEQATLNLPIVEGDEITTSRDARFEIQFDRNTHLRINENAYLKVSKLLDEGIALSLSQGTVALRANSFDKDRSYFEIDAPGSTIAVQRSGMYRIDAGQPGDTEIRVAATGGGEARLYSETSGFTVKNGRSARIFVGGNNAGEWEPGDASLNADAFDRWALDRDMAVAKSLEKAHYDTYYDQDIYGAEDLNDYGEWVYTKKYGYVWRPFRTTVSSYSDWSPYRYGHWRWIPPYGWTWVNDEPWGWATYHHGRWFYDDGYWNWSPYGYYRSMRSWWSPAMVVITTWGGSICWYPLPYSYQYYNYNYYYNNHGWGGGHGGPHPTPTPRITPNPVGTPTPVVTGPIDRIKGPKLPPFQTVPPTGVVTVNADQFGRIRKGNQMPPLAVANAVLSTVPNDQTGVKLPTIKEIKGPLSTGIKAEQPSMIKTQSPVRTGATVRNTDKPLDNDLRTTRVFGGRPPMTTRPDVPPANVESPTVRTPRDTGVIVRPPTVKTEVPTAPMTKTPKPTSPPAETSRPPEMTKPTPRYDPPVRETPRYNPPPPRQDTPRSDPPPTRQPPKSDPPAAKPAPKPDSKPAPIEDRGGGKKKDGPR
ncbi:MAG: FecR domain-containing protein [Pyrinomonadaceae bacterium]|nr:FecR domain-containing protein [Pyrinomonadaceae bacterium]MBP6214538.1 FecR domain-containing protein [Pyrinomonadaceae bacterium]